MNPAPEPSTAAIRDATRRERERILAECRDRVSHEGDIGLLRSCEAHPEHADFLRRQVALMRRFSAYALPGSEAAPEAPFGPFRLSRRLGGGGMGVVFLATEVALERQVALKMLRPEVLDSEAMRLRFAREVRTVASLRHPSIVTIHSCGEHDGIPWFSMEPVEGASLATLLSEAARQPIQARTERSFAKALSHSIGPQTPEPSAAEARMRFGIGWVHCVLHVVLQIADALAHAHGRRVLHRDVKPSNIMVANDGRAVLIDFGLALPEGAQELTRTGAEIGSLPYLAPEVVSGRQTADERTDVWALGVVLYEATTGRLPFAGGEPFITQRAIVRGEVQAPRACNGRISADLETVILSALAPEPMQRYASAAALADDLSRVLAGEPVSARRAGPLLRLRRLVRRHPTVVTSSVLLFLLLVVSPSAWAWNVGATNSAMRRLSDLRITSELIDEEPRLWPATPAILPGPRGLDWWIATATDALARLPQHESSLSEVRSRAVRKTDPPDASASPYEQRLHAELQRVRNQKSGVRQLDRDGYRTWLLELEREEHRIARLLDDRFGWRFATDADAVLHDRLADLVANLRVVAEKLPHLVERRSVALALAKRSLVDHAERWKAVLEEIADVNRMPRYRGLQLEPQLGLVPLGPDPVSGLHEFAHLASGEPAERGADGRLVLTPATGIVLVLVPCGQATLGAIPPDTEHPLGSPHVDPAAGRDDGPIFRVWLDAFFLSKFEVTQGQWYRETGQCGSEYGFGYAHVPGQPLVTQLHPVDGVTREGAEAVLKHWGLRLPTCAQHEYAARAGTTTPWWSGADPRSLQGCENLWDERSSRVARDFSTKPPEPGLVDAWVLHSPVGSFRANPFGLHDMLGNAREWCYDSLAGTTLPPRAGDGLAWNSDSAGLRPGDRSSNANDSRASVRQHGAPGSGAAGFRPSLPVVGKQSFAAMALDAAMPVRPGPTDARGAGR